MPSRERNLARAFSSSLRSDHINLCRGRPGLGGIDIRIDRHPGLTEGVGVVEQPAGAFELRFGHLDACSRAHRRPVVKSGRIGEVDGGERLRPGGGRLVHPGGLTVGGDRASRVDGLDDRQIRAVGGLDIGVENQGRLPGHVGGHGELRHRVLLGDSGIHADNRQSRGVGCLESGVGDFDAVGCRRRQIRRLNCHSSGGLGVQPHGLSPCRES